MALEGGALGVSAAEKLLGDQPLADDKRNIQLPRYDDGAVASRRRAVGAVDQIGARLAEDLVRRLVVIDKSADLDRRNHGHTP